MFCNVTQIVTWPWQAAFITTVTLEIQEKESIKLRVKAQWATEDKMREVLKISPQLGSNLKHLCIGWNNLVSSTLNLPGGKFQLFAHVCPKQTIQNVSCAWGSASKRSRSIARTMRTIPSYSFAWLILQKLSTVAHMESLNQAHIMPRWDKYESKTQYWVEEDLEAEYESKRARMRRETTEYQTGQSVEDAFMNASAPMTLDMAEVRDPQRGSLLYFCVHALKHQTWCIYTLICFIIVYKCDNISWIPGPKAVKIYEHVVILSFLLFAQGCLQMEMGLLRHLVLGKSKSCRRSRKTRSHLRSSWSTWRGSPNVLERSPTLAYTVLMMVSHSDSLNNPTLL